MFFHNLRYRDIKIITFFHLKLVIPLLNLLKQGVTPEKLALSIAFGATLGVFPVIGSTTLLCTIAAFVFRLNLPAIQIVNYSVYPLQFIFLIPFIKIGEFIFQAPSFPFSAEEIVTMIQADVWGSIQTLWNATLYAIVAWLLTGPLVTAAIYVILTSIFRKFKKNSSSQ